jgi:hypothetical protein
VWLSLFTLYRVTNFVTHGFWEAARAVKGVQARRFLQNAQDFGAFLGGDGRNKFFSGVSDLRFSGLGRSNSRLGNPTPGAPRAAAP